jgi:hypothetical protein
MTNEIQEHTVMTKSCEPPNTTAAFKNIFNAGKNHD